MATQKRFIAENGLDNNSNTIPNVADPVNSQDVATKNYTTSNFLGGSSSAYPTMYPTLNLDFANSKQLDSRITFARNSIATYYDGQTNALAEQNLLLQSQGAFSNTTYYLSVSGATITDNNVTAPDGTLTASTFTATAQFSSIKTMFSFPAGTHTFSIYAYRTSGTNLIYVYTNGGTLLGSYSPTSTWARYSITFTLAISETVNITQDRATSGFTPIYIWGAQLEQRSSVTAYTPTTTAAITNYIPQLMTAPAGVARFDCDPITGKSLGLLIEESRTNLATYSGAIGGTGWNLGAVTSTLNSSIAPDGSQTAAQVIPTTSLSAHHMEKPVNTTAGIAYTYSVYLKPSGYDRAAIWWDVNGLITVFDLSLGTIINSGVNSATITYIGNGWYRCTSTYTQPISNGNLMRVYVMQSSQTGISAYAGNGYSGILMWGAQLEVGSFATSYIPTVASTVTRAADDASMTGTNFSSWYNQSEGTFFVKYIYGKKLASIRVCSVSDGTTSNYIDVIAASGTVPAVTYGAYLYGAINGNAGVFSTSSGSTLINTVDTMRTFAGAYKTNDFKSCNDGGYVGVDTSSSVPVVDRLYFSNNTNSTGALLNGHIKKLSYYPVALSASNLVALTT